MDLQRVTDQIKSFTVPTSAGSTRGIGYGSFAGGMVRWVSGTLATITWYSGDSINGPWYKIQDGAGADATSTIATTLAVKIPDSCFGAKFLLPVGDAAGVVNLDVKS